MRIGTSCGKRLVRIRRAVVGSIHLPTSKRKVLDND